MEQYVQVTEDYQLQDRPFGPKIAGIRFVQIKQFHNHVQLHLLILNRGKLEQNLKNLGFTSILHFKPSRDVDEEGEGQGSQEGTGVRESKPKSLKDKFMEKVGEHCKDGAVVFIFVSGHQFPFEVS